MIADKIPEPKNLSAEEKLTLACEPWEEIETHPELLPVREDHARILETRLAKHERHPQDTTPWSEIEKRLLGPR